MQRMRHTRMAACEAACTAHADQRASRAARPRTRHTLLQRTVSAQRVHTPCMPPAFASGQPPFPNQTTHERAHASAQHSHRAHTHTHTREARAAQSRASQGRWHDNDERRQQRGRNAEGMATTSGNESNIARACASTRNTEPRPAEAMARQRRATITKKMKRRGHGNDENRREGKATTSGVSATTSAGRQRQATSGRARSPPGCSTMCRARAATSEAGARKVPVASRRSKAPLRAHR
jgi:hypothetical protein